MAVRASEHRTDNRGTIPRKPLVSPETCCSHLSGKQILIPGLDTFSVMQPTNWNVLGFLRKISPWTDCKMFSAFALLALDSQIWTKALGSQKINSELYGDASKKGAISLESGSCLSWIQFPAGSTRVGGRALCKAGRNGPVNRSLGAPKWAAEKATGTCEGNSTLLPVCKALKPQRKSDLLYQNVLRQRQPKGQKIPWFCSSLKTRNRSLHCRHPILEHRFKSQLFCFQSSFLPICLGKHLGFDTCHHIGDLDGVLCSWLWPCPSISELNQKMESSLFLPLLFSVIQSYT